MAAVDGEGEAEELLRLEAADWHARMTGQDSERSRPEFERWRARDPRNCAAYARIERVDVFASAGRHGEFARDRNLSRARSHGLKSKPMLYALAAAAALILSIASAVLMSRPRVGTGSLARNGAVSTGIGQLREQRLADGSTLTLDTDSRVEVALSDRVRVVRLIQGRARFAVSHDAERPFIVEAAGQTVTAKGTVFDVFIDHDWLRVSLLRGKVDVAQATGSAPHTGSAVAHLIAGQALRAGLGKGAQIIVPIRRGESQWPTGMLSFDKIPLADLLEQTNRYSRTKIRLAEPALGALLVTGAFRPSPVEELAAGLAAAFSLKAEREPVGDIVLRRR